MQLKLIMHLCKYFDPWCFPKSMSTIIIITHFQMHTYLSGRLWDDMVGGLLSRICKDVTQSDVSVEVSSLYMSTSWNLLLHMKIVTCTYMYNIQPKKV